jgi:predicted secreted hydrolase
MFKQMMAVLSALILIGCSEPDAPSFGQMLGSDDGQFEEVKSGRNLSFPEDHQAHNDFRQEWWYLTANLQDAEGREYGIQWTQFRLAVSSEAPANKNGWQSQQIFMAHSAITTPNTHLADEKWSRQHPEIADVSSQPFRVFIDDWQWTSTTNGLFPATLDVASNQFGYQLSLTRTAPYQKQGDEGYSEKSADGKVASYYYSQPFIDVHGTVSINGESHQVSGQGWIDREWSSQFLLDSQQGWDWFAIRLDEVTSLVVFQLRDSATGQVSYSYGRLMYKDGRGITLTQNDLELLAVQQTEIEGQSYPTQWILKVVSQNINVKLSALNPNAKMPLSIPYWEGPIIVEGSHQGRGYMELTGY